MVMPKLRTLSLAHLPSDLAVHLALFEDLQNSRFLRKQLLEGNSDFEHAFVDARTILSEAHVLAAVFRAVNDMANGRMKSRNVHSEIVFAMNSNNNIAESFRKFGISDQTRKLLVIKIASADYAEAIAQQLEWAVEGRSLDFDDATLSLLSDMTEIRKTYKLNATPKSKAIDISEDGGQGQMDRNEERSELEVAILGLIALRGAT
ncbi:MAG: hypothetical protein MMC23_003429 [Stictis urceolatum]|nr:hypothetical protein [Stictis urceolata]